MPDFFIEPHLLEALNDPQTATMESMQNVAGTDRNVVLFHMGHYDLGLLKQFFVRLIDHALDHYSDLDHEHIHILKEFTAGEINSLQPQTGMLTIPFVVGSGKPGITRPAAGMPPDIEFRSAQDGGITVAVGSPVLLRVMARAGVNFPGAGQLRGDGGPDGHQL